MKYLLDTHAWIWWHVNPKKISRKVLALLTNPARYEELLLSAISPWEFCKLVEKGRLGINCDPENWLATALDMPKLRIVALTPRRPAVLVEEKRRRIRRATKERGRHVS